MSKYLCAVLFSALLCFSLNAQNGYSKQYDFIMNGEAAQSAFAYMDGFLLVSAQYGNPTVENTIRKIDANDSVERNIRFNDNFRHYFWPVVATNNNIFVFGVPTFVNSTEVNYVVMDSNFTVLQEKKLNVPYNIVFCKFYPAKDGGVIGVVHEVCNESRIFRLDQNGDIVWIKSFVGMLGSGLYDRTIVNSIYLTASNEYLITGHLGYGYGLFFFVIDDYGTVLRSTCVEAFQSGSYSDVMWHTAFDGEKALCFIDNATNGRDTTFLIEVDTSLNILNMNRIIYTDSTAQSRSLFATSREFILCSTIRLYPPFNQSEMIVTGFDKNTLAVNWTFSTNGNNTGDYGYYCFAGARGTDDRPVFFYNAGPMNLILNGGNNYDYWTMVKLDTMQQLGFCDKMPTTTLSIPVMWDTTLYYIDTIAHPYCYVTSATHAVSYVVNGDPEPECNFNVGMAENSMEKLLIAPNPTCGIVMWNQQCNAELFDINGKRVLKKSNTNSIDLSEFSTGIYFVVLRNFEGTILTSTKIIRD